MFSPPGYKSVFNLQSSCEARHGGRIGRRWQRGVWLHNQIFASQELFAYSAETGLVQVPLHALARLEREYAFIDTLDWTISLSIVREASHGISENNLALGMYILQGSFQSYPGKSVAIGLEQYESCSLAVSDLVADKILGQLTQLPENEPESNTPRRLSTAQAEREWKEWVKTFNYPDSPNKTLRETWGKERGISREGVRILQRSHSPSYWTKPGRR